MAGTKKWNLDLFVEMLSNSVSVNKLSSSNRKSFCVRKYSVILYFKFYIYNRDKFVFNIPSSVSITMNKLRFHCSVPNIWFAGFENVGVYCFRSAVWLGLSEWSRFQEMHCKSPPFNKITRGLNCRWSLQLFINVNKLSLGHWAN